MAEQSFSTGVVTNISEETKTPLENPGDFGYFQVLDIKEDKTQVERDVKAGSEQLPLTFEQRYRVGDRVVLVTQAGQDGQLTYFVSDHYRLPAMMGLTFAFFVIVILVSRLKGVTSLLGMGLSLAILMFFMVPQLIHGANPVLISIVTAGLISSLIIYLGHGFHYRSHVALFCMLLTLSVVGILSHFIVQWAFLSGTGDETANFLQFSGIGAINLRGLFLGGIILAALSVLDDSVVSQVSVIYQLKTVKKELSLRELFDRGMEVGKDHISTLVNTLILAYAGASLPLFILFTITTNQPSWVSLNDQLIAEEVVRTLAGSIGLVLSIPLTTLVASYIITLRHQK